MDIVDGDNAAEIAGEQRGLMMTLLASERIERVARGQGLPVYILLHAGPSLFAHPLFLPSPNQAAEKRRFVFVVRRDHTTPCVSHGIITIGSIATPVSILVN